MSNNSFKFRMQVYKYKYTEINSAICAYSTFQIFKELQQRRRAVTNDESIAEFTIFEIGGARRDRTDDPLLAKQVLSQLSYGPLTGLFCARPRCRASSFRSFSLR